MPSKQADPKPVVIPKIHVRRVDIKVEGISDLIVHNWSEKAKSQIRDKQQKQAAMKKEAKDPVADFEAAKYLDSNGRDCVKSAAFKNAIVDAASFASDVTKVSLRGAFFIVGELLPIGFKECIMREDPVKIGMGTADLRYRPAYRGWICTLPIEFNAAAISLEQLVNMINLAGFSIGICEWRPQRDGDFGRFRVVG
jgi:hypothetical protein